ncbi:hypothetical protein PIB30_077429 [Stylosanthes scabra]|uniref:Uncharacterized protein n=1 Tax=Stylosanthes scabra TaxID=79078 RepID=A0ABU6RRA1_9FABA|nr:hypothetical protein [Stylosanthes scabra]
MEETYSYDQGYTPWNPPPYQHHAPQHNTHQSNGFGDAYYGYEDPPPPYPPSQGNIEDILQVHECLEEVEEENVDQEVVDEDKESKGVQSASSEATSPESPSKLHFEWVNVSDMNLFGPQHYGLLETDGQLRALCGVMDKKKMDSLGLDKSRFITCGESEFKAYSGHLHKLHNNRTKVGALNLRKHLGPWQSQEKLVDSQSNGWTNQVWDPGKRYKNQHFWGLTTYLGILASLMYMIWSPTNHTKFKHWWKLQEEFKHKPP